MSIKGNWKRAVFLAASLSIIMASGCSLLPKEEEPLAPPLVKPVKQNFTTVEVKKGAIEQSVTGIGYLEPYATIYHQFKTGGGRVKEIFVKQGDRVKKGDPLIQLEVEGLDLEILYKTLELEKARNALAEARTSQDESLIKIKSLEYKIADKNYQLMQEKINNRLLKAEMDGLVTFVTDVKPPDFVEPYANLVVVADTTKLHLLLEKSDTNSLAGAELGMEAELKFEGKTLKGKVTQTPSSAPITNDESLRARYSRAIYISLDEIPEEAEIGEMMDVKIITRKKENALIIPTTALRTFITRNYVQVMDGERISEADVEVGIRTATEIEIVAGVEEGQQLILR